jgi:Arc/MetJ family transcription regulator
MKVTTNLDGPLLARAIKAIRARSQREAIEAGLRQLLKEVERATFVKEFSRFDLRWTPKSLERSRR